jgi:type IV pilus assembly protein PilF
LSKPNLKILSSICLLSTTFLVVGCQTISDSKVDPIKSAQARTQIAAEYIRKNDFDAAKRELDLAMKLNSRDPTANMMMGVLLQREGSPSNVEKADRYFKAAVSSDPKNAQARNNYGTYLYQLGRYNDALEQFKVAGSTLGYDQRYVALENVGRAYVKLGDITNAEKAFTHVLKNNRNSYVSMVELAELYYLRQDIPAATNLYEQSVQLVGQNNQNARALWIGIRLARANGNPLQTQVLVNQLRALYPDSPEYQRYLQLQYSTEGVWK